MESMEVDADIGQIVKQKVAMEAGGQALEEKKQVIAEEKQKHEKIVRLKNKIKKKKYQARHGTAADGNGKNKK